jgi:aspartyl-tRNA(Asn)/glutamyl-tRNA(Gln) amidotransferase subunit B
MAKAAEEALRVSAEVLARYETVIGLEVHAQLQTATKAFCACSTAFGDAPNTNVCPVCLGLPGALPVLNRRALELAARAALALGCEIQDHSRFARKNYFYPDLPKGYQISMYELPLATCGVMEFDLEGSGLRRVGITRVHMEEDAAKAMHEGFADSAEYSYVDFNRSGVPLIEIVSEPDIRAPGEAHAYLNALKEVLEYTEVSDCNMEEGSLRCDANVSVRLRGEEKLGTRTEMKNLNSFRYLQRALEYEIERQIGEVDAGRTIVQETRLWNVAAGRTEAMRSKELAHDYRYFPEPDLLPVNLNAAWKDKIRGDMRELPAARRSRFAREYGITPYDAEVLTATRGLADYFEAVTAEGAPSKAAANWMTTELLRRLNDVGTGIADCTLDPRNFAELVKMVESGEITAQSGKKVFAKMFGTLEAPREIVAAEGLGQISDADAIEGAARAVIEKNPENAAKYRGGNEGVFKFFVGQVMRETKGQANPQQVNDVLKRLLNE